MPVIDATTVHFDPDLYPRTGLDPDNVERLAEALRSGATLPPIVVAGKKHTLIDGYHRLSAWRKVHGDEVGINAVVKTYADKQEMLLDAMRLNAQHGKALTGEDRIRCVDMARRMEVSTEAVAEALSLTTQTAAKMNRKPSVPSRPNPVARPHPNQGSGVWGQKTQGIGELEGGAEVSFYINRLIIAFANETVPTTQPVCEQLKELAGSVLRHIKKHGAAA